MKITKLLILIILAILISNCTNKKTAEDPVEKENLTEAVEKSSMESTLFERLGETEGITKIVEGLLNTHVENQVVSRFFTPIQQDQEKMDLFIKHVVEFMSAGTGGDAVYTGKDLISAHKGMQITEAEFLSATDDIMAVLSDNNIDEESKKDVLYIFFNLKAQVIAQ